MDSINTGAKMQRKTLFEFWRTTSRNNKINQVLVFVKSQLTDFVLLRGQEKHLKTFLKAECHKISVKWQRKQRRLDLFLKSHSDWLNQEIIFDMFRYEPPKSITSCKGRPTKSFAESSKATKKRKIHHLLESYDENQLSLAAELSVRASGKRDAASLIQEVSSASPKRATRYKKARILVDQVKEKQRPYTPEEALSLFIHNNFTVQTYKDIQQDTKERGYRLYPCYDLLLKVKKQCHPPVEKFTLTDNYAEVELQALLNHTVTRICINILGKDLLRPDVFASSYTMIYKWGCDGSSGHSIYKQIFQDDSDTDEYMFIISLVPLRLVKNIDASSGKSVVWENPRPSSPRFCRTIKFLYKKETESLIKQEVDAIQDQINKLLPTFLTIEEAIISIEHKLILSMVDGKVCNVISENKSSQRCYICKATSKEMNVENFEKEPDENLYRFGISSLHAYIRTMECLLNIAGKLGIGKWQARGDENKDIVKNRKNYIKKEFKKVGLIIDKVIPGMGTSNDGNTARAFFRDAKGTSLITGINEELIYRLGTLLAAIASGYEIDPDKYQAYCLKTRELYLSLYPWYNMPATLHKILMHGAEIIRHSIIPIGQMSEEASEAKNKEIRKVRLGHTLKTSRVRTNFDLLKYLLVSSDPYITLLKKLPKKNYVKHCNDLKELLI